MKGTINDQAKEAVVRALNLSHLTDSEQEKIVTIILDIIAAKVNMAVWSQLSDEEKEKVAKIAKSSPERTLEHLGHTVKGFPKLVEDATRQTIESFNEKKAKLAQKTA
ncbi:hypothetical protein KW786_00390 [Candidatus Parcubacteria bacterium]|nr:hypothetical protein [Candidatus Parcubacteria bacterium]